MLAEETLDGTVLSAHWSWDRAKLTAVEVERLGRAWCDVLSHLAVLTADSGGHTPSDFPLVRLDQEQVEEVEALYPTVVDVLPVTPLQQELPRHTARVKHGGDVYNVQVDLDLDGEVDPDIRAAGRTAAG
ncbi:hypothetical protein [Lentzea flava]|uniref:Condensation domain-containing protein n=1 Tax=Lentzea flava TaxID=103732 RepID=A0ABQ2UTX5_9PSEU|nr:hypothetical protein [Lentzea flava]MCP2201445.1 non-ribosomal peptide synthase domain TIGR01720 [Lentzea flava]GGU50988.1 hypothetical protein GCM10010178_49720 [Lentzea flava]